MQHQPNIRFDDDLVSTSFTVRDASAYAPNIPVKTPVLEVIAPGSTSPVLFSDILPGFTKTVESNALHLNSTGVFPSPAIPDGNYFLRYSVAPNARVFVEYNYFRTVRVLNKLLLLSSDFIASRSRFTSSFYNKKVQELLWYRHLIDTAKYTAEDLHDTDLATKIYCEVDDTLKRFNTCEKC